MAGTEYQLYRLNFVDRIDLFERPVVTDADVLEVFSAASRGNQDVVRNRKRNGYRWSIRNVLLVTDAGVRPYISGIYSQDKTYRTEPIVVPDGIGYGTSAITPSTATTLRFFIDLKRHLLAIEDVSAILGAQTGWKNIFS